jgi:hypothetical protein
VVWPRSWNKGAGSRIAGFRRIPENGGCSRKCGVGRLEIYCWKGTADFAKLSAR